MDSPLTGKAIIVALRQADFDVLRINRSHHFLRHPDGRTTVIPVHPGDPPGPGLLAKILHDVDPTRDDLEALLCCAEMADQSSPAGGEDGSIALTRHRLLLACN
jgi:predicted RNA binding protein YcfA (HicA-like mRNA interferase family)